jgi:hypothetical protein
MAVYNGLSGWHMDLGTRNGLRPPSSSILGNLNMDPSTILAGRANMFL